MHTEEAIKLFLTGYFSTCSRSRKTETAYRTDLAQFQAQFGCSQQLDAITSEALESWAKKLTSDGYAAVSVRRKFAALRVFFSYWVRKGALDHSPFWKIRLDLARERQLPRNITALDAKRLLERAWHHIEGPVSGMADPSDGRFLAVRNVAAIEVLFATGIRVGELVSLTLADWNLEEASFTVKGKGSRQRLALLPDQRSLVAVKTYLKHRKEMALSNDALLVNASGGRLSSQGVARMLARLATEAGMVNKVTPHMIRHTVATLLLRNGADIRVVQEVLGHSSISMTQRYTHVTKEHLRATLQVHHPSHHLGIDTHLQLSLF